jgi:hypothetical protein
MKLTKTIACTAAFLLTPGLAWAELAPSHDHGAGGQSQPAQGETGKPHDMKCPMMQDMHSGMKMDGQATPHGGGQHPTTGSGGMKGMDEIKCMHDGAVAKPTSAPSAPEGQHSHDHSGPGTPQ